MMRGGIGDMKRPINLGNSNYKTGSFFFQNIGLIVSINFKVFKIRFLILELREIGQVSGNFVCNQELFTHVN